MICGNKCTNNTGEPRSSSGTPQDGTRNNHEASNSYKHCQQVKKRCKPSRDIDGRRKGWSMIKDTTPTVDCLTSSPNFMFTWPCIVINFFLIKPTDAAIFPNLFLSRSSTCFGQFLYPSSGVLHCTFGTGTCHAEISQMSKITGVCMCTVLLNLKKMLQIQVLDI